MRVSSIIDGGVWIHPERVDRMVRVSLERSGDCAGMPAISGRHPAVGYRIRCVSGRASSELHPASAGAETALFNRDRYFSGSQRPGGEPI